MDIDHLKEEEYNFFSLQKIREQIEWQDIQDQKVR